MKILNKNLVSYSYKILFTCFIILIPTSPATLAQDSQYRVELVVLRHLDGPAAQQPVSVLQDFSAAFDLQPRDTHDIEAADIAAPTSSSAEFAAGSSVDQPAALAEPPAPPALIVTEPGEVMQAAWRRLRLSADFRPEFYLSWQQGGAQPFPLIRVHDDQLLFEQAPASAATYGTPADFPPLVPTFDQTNTRSNGSAIDPAAETPTPDLAPNLFYRIDGTASLQRSRFLHLDLDVELREPLAANADPDQTVATGGTAGAVPPKAFRVYAIEQRRQVKLEQMAYFDGPVIGILALVTRVENTLPPSGQDGLAGVVQ